MSGDASSRPSTPEDWSAKQGRILTGDGTLVRLYTAERGFPFSKDELPHHHLLANNTHAVFRSWRQHAHLVSELIVGAWKRPLFVGGWEHSDDLAGESVFNLQTRSLFIDIRIPVGAKRAFAGCRSLSDLSIDDLCLFSQRHAFAGYSVVSPDLPSRASPHNQSPPVCVRHHAIDWNFVGTPRPRPNKWRIEMAPNGNVWKEWGWPTDDFGQHVYMERWERLPHGRGKTVALRRVEAGKPDAFLVVVGDHFNYIYNRTPSLLSSDGTASSTPPPPSLGALVGQLAAAGDRTALEAWLGLRAGHGTISSGWIIDAALHPWERGVPLISQGDVSIADDGAVCWRGEQWEALEMDFTVSEARKLFHAVPQSSKL